MTGGSWNGALQKGRQKEQGPLKTSLFPLRLLQDALKRALEYNGVMWGYVGLCGCLDVGRCPPPLALGNPIAIGAGVLASGDIVTTCGASLVAIGAILIAIEATAITIGAILITSGAITIAFRGAVGEGVLLPLQTWAVAYWA